MTMHDDIMLMALTAIIATPIVAFIVYILWEQWLWRDR